MSDKIARRKSKRNSLFARARSSFVRSGGERGADLDTLRGNNGGDFEGKGKIRRDGGSGSTCGCFGGAGDGEPKKERIVLIKGQFLFVFSSEDAPSPKYAISLANMKANVTDTSHGITTCTLGNNLGDVEYTFMFDAQLDPEIGTNFKKAVAKESAAAQEEEVKKRLGHAHLLNKRSSIRFAESIAVGKLDAQPEAPVSAGEILDANPGMMVPM